MTCNKCGSEKLRGFSLATIFFLGFLISIWIPILGWMLAPILLIGGFVALFIPKRFIRCQECKNMMTVNKSTYKEFKALN